MKLTPIEQEIDRLQNERYNIYIYGWDEEGKRCLVVQPDTHIVTVAKADSDDIGRWQDTKVTSSLARLFQYRARLESAASSPTELGADRLTGIANEETGWKKTMRLVDSYIAANREANPKLSYTLMVERDKTRSSYADKAAHLAMIVEQDSPMAPLANLLWEAACEAQ